MILCCCNPDGSETMEFGYGNVTSASVSAAAAWELVHREVCVVLSAILGAPDIPT